jgi:hypothetical protein
MYRIGFPLWKQIARLGVPLTVRVHVMRDDEAGVFVATSNDLRGLVCEAKTMDDLIPEINSSVNDLLTFHLDGNATRPVTDLRICAA